MLRALLILTLCTLVLLPQRFCTCTLAGDCCESNSSSDAVSTPVLPPAKVHHCKRHRHESHAETATKEQESQSGPSCPKTPSQPSSDHHPECPLVKPTTAGESLKPVQLPIMGSPDVCVLEAIELAHDRTSRHRIQSYPAHPPHVPLYISLLVLLN